MHDTHILAQLMAQAEQAGSDITTLKALVEEACETGAHRAMSAIGLADSAARTDMDELRQLLAAWRDAKASARRALVEWVVRILLALLLIGLAVRHGLIAEVLRG